MSDVRLSNASPTVERVEARPQDSVRPVRRALFGRASPEDARRYADAATRESVRDFTERYNFDPVEERPLSPGRFEWQVDEDAPEFYRRPPHGSQPAAAAAPPGTAARRDGSRKRASGSCADECPTRRSRSDNQDDDDDEDSPDGAGTSPAVPAVEQRPGGSESGRVEVS